MKVLVQHMEPASDQDLLDEDRDSLHTLAISIQPIGTQMFRRARIVKNARLDSAIEFFRGTGCGRGQIEIRNIAKFLSLEQTPPHPDVQLLQTVAALPSFDVYSLRILLRAKNISISNTSALTLSPAKIASLSSYMA